jgi:acetolactate synthase I/III small subunit
MIMKYTFSILVEDEPGILTRITGLFTRRGFNLESITIGSSEKPGISRLTLIVPTEVDNADQITKQLYKLINVLKVENITDVPSVDRELMLLKISAIGDSRAKILDLVTIFRIRIVDLSADSLILEVIGDPGKVVVIEQLFSKFGVLEIARTGMVALTRTSKINTEYLRTIPRNSYAIRR